MSAAAETEQPAEKSSKKGLIVGVILAVAGGGGGFFVTYSGLASSLLGGGDQHSTAATESTAGTSADTGHGSTTAPPSTSGNTAFVPLEPITISLGPRGQSRHLRFSAQLEVANNHSAEVQRLMPRITDVLNIYLRALDPHELEEPAALLRLRAQMLRRVQIVTGPGFVNDLLVMEFVLN
ncbi:flagellar basal body-associated FliL family protein [Pararhodobacter sp.]|uniref:flagellar basal body-associated FliL family protein n=1 Tax=Pararhodobacter sp. TaxID=2127056 RepID=UPI002AFF82C9|nr:flagellar basal body-associated FliL family protein [Pararhodobacter sp.]